MVKNNCQLLLVVIISPKKAEKVKKAIKPPHRDLNEAMGLSIHMKDKKIKININVIEDNNTLQVEFIDDLNNFEIKIAEEYGYLEKKDVKKLVLKK